MPGDFSIKPYIQAEGGAFSYRTPSLAGPTVNLTNSISVITEEGTKTYSDTKSSSYKSESKEQWVSNAGIKFGAKAQKGNIYADAGLTFGNKFKADLKAGYEINLGKEFGLDLSVHGQHISNMPTTKSDNGIPNISVSDSVNIDLSKLTNAMNDLNNASSNLENASSNLENGLNSASRGYAFTNDMQYQNNIEITYGNKTPELQILNSSVKMSERFSSESSLGAGASVKYKKPWGQIGVGFEAGVRRSVSHADVSANIMGEKSEESGYYTQNGVYATPNVSAEVNLGKGFSLNGNVDSRNP